MFFQNIIHEYSQKAFWSQTLEDVDQYLKFVMPWNHYNTNADQVDASQVSSFFLFLILKLVIFCDKSYRNERKLQQAINEKLRQN